LSFAPRQALSNDFGLEGIPLFYWKPIHILAEARLALLVDHEDKGQHPKAALERVLFLAVLVNLGKAAVNRAEGGPPPPPPPSAPVCPAGRRSEDYQRRREREQIRLFIESLRETKYPKILSRNGGGFFSNNNIRERGSPAALGSRRSSGLEEEAKAVP
jgi:hypothetical protein